ncbi:MAG: MYXO-CTERM sorting domain-containing protein, partial [Myxococcota bacterium]|nr:MYXO-CTERM sorting domain-containing protein [Myxococcota bacterium]
CAVWDVDPEATSIGFEDYLGTIQADFLDCLDVLPHPELVDYLVLVRGLPYRVDLDDGSTTSLSAMLQVHQAADSDGTALAGQGQGSSSSYWYATIDNPIHLSVFSSSACDFEVDNPYAGSYTSACKILQMSEGPSSFTRSDAGTADGFDFDGNLFVVTRLDGFDHGDALDLVERGAAADGTFPDAEILCMEGADEARAARDPECEMVTRYLAGAGANATYLEPHDATLSGHEVAAYWSGAADLTGAIAGNTYVPGAIVDNLTSYGAVPQNFSCDESGESCPASESQTSIARFVRAGATGVHGTVAEPLNNSFPSAGSLLLYTMGYNLGESFLFTQPYLYWQNLVLGDPLTSPFAERPEVDLSSADGSPQDGVLTVPEGGLIRIEAFHSVGVSETRLFVDGAWVDDSACERLRWPVEGDEGDSFEVLAVAFATNETQLNEGWPTEEILPLTDVQGWARAQVTLSAPIDGGADDAGDDDCGEWDTGEASVEGSKGSSCGCTSSPSPSSGVLGLLAMVGMAGARRRRP